MDQLNQEQAIQPLNQAVSSQESSVSATESPQKPYKKIVIFVLVGLVIGGIAIGYFLSQQSGRQSISASHYLGTQTINLSDVMGTDSSGTATRNITADNFSYSVKTSLPKPFEGQFYQVWVINSEDSVFPIGNLSKNQDGSFSLVTNYNIDPLDTFTFSGLYNTLVVTFETSDDGVIGTRMLESAFTE